MRSQIKKRQRNRRLIIVGVVVVIGVALVVGAYYLSTLTTPLDKQVGQPVSSSDYQAFYAVSQTGYGNVNQSLMNKVAFFNGTEYTSGGKPIIVYIGADYCPYCAFQRWPLVMALMRFGNFTNLSYMLSSSTDVFPDSPTFSFYGSTYKSNYIVFQGFEQEDRSENPLMTVPSNYTGAFSQFGSSYPFINFADRYVLSGALYFPDQMDGKNWTQIIQLLSSNSVVSNEVVTSANAMTAVICKVTNNVPSSVCGSGSITTLTDSLAAYHLSGGSTTQGASIASASAVANLRFSLVTMTAATVAGPKGSSS